MWRTLPSATDKGAEMADVRRIYELVSSIVLDSAVADVATADAAVVAEHSSAVGEQELSIARAEAWRQLRARNIFPHDIPAVAVPGDPVSALTVAERTVLALSVRFALPISDVAKILGDSERTTAAILKSARRELARSAIAMTLLTNATRCPVISQAERNLGERISRAQALNLVSHSAECSICVPVLRTVDKQIAADYANVPIADVPTNIQEMIEQRDATSLTTRAALKNGWAPRDSQLSSDPRKMLRRAIIWGAASTALVIAGVILKNLQ